MANPPDNEQYGTPVELSDSQYAQPVIAVDEPYTGRDDWLVDFTSGAHAIPVKLATTAAEIANAIGVVPLSGYFSASLTHSAIPEYADDKSYTFSRNDSAATVTDWEGLVHQVELDEIRFPGARRAKTMATGLVTETITVVSGNEYQVTIKGANGDTAVCSGAFAGILKADGTNRISWPNGTPKTASSTSLTITVTGTLTELLVEDVTGQSNKNPSEYVSVGISEDHGTNVDGVKYFPYENDNTVDANGVVTEVRGADLTTMEGVLIEESSENLCRYSEDMDNAGAWGAPVSGIITVDGIGVRGLITATKIENNTGATAQTRLPQFVSANAGNAAGETICASVYMDKQTGGYGSLRLDNNTDGVTANCVVNLQTGAVVSVAGGVITTGDVIVEDHSSTKWRVGVPLAFTTANASVSIYIAPARAAGDYSVNYASSDDGGYVYVDACQVEIGDSPSSYIPTTSGTVVRNEELGLDYPKENVNLEEGSMVFDFSFKGETGAAQTLMQLSGTGGGIFQLRRLFATSKIRYQITLTTGDTDLDSLTALAPNTSYTIGLTWGPTGAYLYIDGTLEKSSASPVDASAIDPNVSVLKSGNSVATGNEINGNIGDVKLYNKALSQADMEALTA